MRLRSGRAIHAATGIAVAGLIGALTAVPAAQDKPLLAEQVFKNIQVLRGIPVDDFLGTMGIMAAALQFDCSDCHVAAGTEKVDWAADTPRKQMARVMVTMVATINKTHFGGRQVVTCWTCHRNRDKPLVTPDMATIYGTPVVERDDVLVQAPGAPSPESILDRYIAGCRRGPAPCGPHQLCRQGDERQLRRIRRRRRRRACGAGPGQARHDHPLQERNRQGRPGPNLRRTHGLAENAAQRAGRVSVDRDGSGRGQSRRATVVSRTDQADSHESA